MLRNLLDRIATSLGYFTQLDVDAARLENANQTTTDDANQLRDHADRNPLPPGYIGYFVSYSIAEPNGLFGYGCIEIGRTQTIRSQEDVVTMVSLIEGIPENRRGNESVKVVILNWKRFEQPIDDGARKPVPQSEPQNVVLRLVA